MSSEWHFYDEFHIFNDENAYVVYLCETRIDLNNQAVACISHARHQERHVGGPITVTVMHMRHLELKREARGLCPEQRDYTRAITAVASAFGPIQCTPTRIARMAPRGGRE